jgi:hypothetical protein
MKDRKLFAMRMAFAAGHIGWIGWAGVAALLAGIGAIAIGLPLAQRASARQLDEIAGLQAQLALQSDPRTARHERDPRGALVAVLPPARAVAEFVAAIQRRADAQSVQIDRTEYRVQPALGHAAERYRLHFPAHVDYPHLRVWLEGLLHDYPNLSLDDLSLRRAADGGEELEASIGLSFLARESP